MTQLDKTFTQYFPLKLRLIMLPIIVLAAAAAVGAIATQQPMIAVGLVLAASAALIVVVWPDASTLAVAFILYTNAAVVAVRFHGVPVIVGAALPVLLVIPLADYLISRRQRIVVNPVLLLLFLFLIVQLLGTLFSSRIGDAMAYLTSFLIEGIGLYFLITNVVRTSEMLRRVTWALLIAGALMGGLSLFQQLTGTFDNIYWGFAQVGDTGFGTGVETLQGQARQARLEGPLGEKNYYAQIMLMLVPIGLFRLWGERSKGLRALAAIATGLAMIGATLPFSRGAAVGFILMLVIMALMRYLKLYQFLIVVLGLVLIMQLFPQYGVRLTSLQALTGVVDQEGSGVAGTDRATRGRLGEMWAAGLVFADYPIIGVGPGQFQYYYADYADSIGLQVHTGTREAHNLYLDVAAETGALGLILFLAILFVTLRNLARIRKQWMQSRPELANMATGFLLAVVSYMTTAIFLSLAYERYLWLILALAGATSYIAKVEGSVEIPQTRPELHKSGNYG